jgi:hypothetical protein
MPFSKFSCLPCWKWHFRSICCLFRTWLFATNWECHSQNSLAFHVGNDILDLFLVSFVSVSLAALAFRVRTLLMSLCKSQASSRKPSTVNHRAIQIQSILRLPSKHDAWHIPRHSNCIAGTSFFDTGKQQLGVKWPSLPLNTHQGFTFLLFKSCHTIDPNVTVFI